MEKFYSVLVDPASPVEDKYLAIFELKQIASPDAVLALKKAFDVLNAHPLRSCLLLHEIAYAFGQLPLQYADDLGDWLLQVINDGQQFDIVRHEAAEALANLCQGKHMATFEHYRQQLANDEQRIFADTCELAVSKLASHDTLKGLYGLQYSGTREPAAPFTVQEMTSLLNADRPTVIDYILSDSSLFDKYRGLYYIRNSKDGKLVLEMTKLLHNDSLGALLKHEICFILGQIGTECPLEVVPELIAVCVDPKQPDIVRHEAIAAFQTIHPDQQVCRDFLLKFVDDPSQIVRETVRVSLKVSGV